MKRSGKLTAKEIFIVVALILFLIPGICGMYSGIHRIVEKACDPENKQQDIIFGEEYPFNGADADLTSAGESSLPEKFSAVASKLTEKIDNHSGIKNIVSPLFLDLYGKTMEALGKNLIDDTENPVIRLRNGYLTYTYLYSQEYAEYEGFAVFKEWLSKDAFLF